MDASFAVSYIRQQKFDYMIAADSGIHFFIQAGLRPNEVLGDFDSADPKQIAALRKDPGILFQDRKSVV